VKGGGGTEPDFFGFFGLLFVSLDKDHRFGGGGEAGLGQKGLAAFRLGGYELEIAWEAVAADEIDGVVAEGAVAVKEDKGWRSGLGGGNERAGHDFQL
jgi:hypothetical protein